MEGASLGSSGQGCGARAGRAHGRGQSASHSTPQSPTSFSLEGQKGGGRGGRGEERHHLSGQLHPNHWESPATSWGITSVREGWSL